MKKRFLAVAAFALATNLSCAQQEQPYLELLFDFDPGTRKVSAEAQLTLNTGGPFTFDLAQRLYVESAQLDGAPLRVRRYDTDDALRHFEIRLPEESRPRTLRIRYRGTLPALDPALSHREVLGAILPMGSPDGSFLPAGSGWYPRPGVPFSYRLTVRTPSHQVAVAPGAPIEEHDDGMVRTATFEFPYPAEGIDLMVGPYTVKERRHRLSGRDVRLRTYFHAELGDLADGYLDSAGSYLERYSTQIGMYPYSDFSIVSSPLPTGFGMPTLTYLGREVLKLPFIRGTSLGHEVLHNWWGNGVSVDPARGNWSEGLTTFMADYAYREDAGADAAREMRHGWLRDLAALPENAEQPLSAFRARHHSASSAVGYGKSAMLFFALRERLGTESFDAALRQFWKSHRHTRASFYDLAKAFEAQSGGDLSAFFAQWLERTGAPAIRVTGAGLTQADASYRLALTIEQDPADRSADVPLRVLHENGHDDFLAAVEGRTTDVELTVSQRPLAVQVDPEFTVWRKLAPTEAPPILRDVVASPRLHVVALATELRDGALALAGALSEGEAKTAGARDALRTAEPVLVAGSASAIDRFLRNNTLAPRPAEAGSSDVQVWIAPGTERKLVLVSLPDDVEAANAMLESLARRLPHLARYAWVTFEDGLTAGRGGWPIESPRFPVK
ncbi:MAG: M1 family aminopeptidase [Burkholderiales bacterium]